MAYIGKIRLLYDGEYPIEHKIFYNQAKYFYIKDLSQEFRALTAVIPWGYKTEEALRSAMIKATILYRKLKTTAKYVILYKLETSNELSMNKTEQKNTSTVYSGHLPGVSNKIRSAPLGCSLATIGIDYMIAQVVDNGVRPVYYKANPKTGEVSQFEVHDESYYQKMDWTEERETFFDGIVESMKKLVVSISKFIGAEPEEAIKFIESNIKLLK